MTRGVGGAPHISHYGCAVLYGATAAVSHGMSHPPICGLFGSSCLRIESR